MKQTLELGTILKWAGGGKGIITNIRDASVSDNNPVWYYDISDLRGKYKGCMPAKYLEEQIEDGAIKVMSQK